MDHSDDGSDDEREAFAKQGGEALDLDGDFNDSEDVDDEEEDPEEMMGMGVGGGDGSVKKEVKGEKLENQPYDLAVDVNDSEEIESDEEEDEVTALNEGAPGQAAAAQTQQQQSNTQSHAGQKPMSLQQQKAASGADDEDDDGDDDKEVPGTYDPSEYAGLQVSAEVKELFEYIQRYKPQKIDLDSKMKPFVPDYVPAVGEVDAFLKMPKPDGEKEDLGITQLDEPALNCEDKTVLELKYIQCKNVVRAAPTNVDSIDGADKKPKEINRWISSVQDLHKSRHAPTVNYTKQMPDFDVLMSELNPEMEQAIKQFEFPGPEIDMHTSDYARLVCAMLDVPCHKLANNKSIVESLHVLFTLFSEFRQNQHFQNNENGQGGGAAGVDLAQF